MGEKLCGKVLCYNLPTAAKKPHLKEIRSELVLAETMENAQSVPLESLQVKLDAMFNKPHPDVSEARKVRLRALNLVLCEGFLEFARCLDPRFPSLDVSNCSSSFTRCTVNGLNFLQQR